MFKTQYEYIHELAYILVQSKFCSYLNHGNCSNITDILERNKYSHVYPITNKLINNRKIWFQQNVPRAWRPTKVLQVWRLQRILRPPPEQDLPEPRDAGDAHTRWSHLFDGGHGLRHGDAARGGEIPQTLARVQFHDI